MLEWQNKTKRRERLSLRKNFDDFIQTFDSDNTAKVAKSLCVIGEYDY